MESVSQYPSQVGNEWVFPDGTRLPVISGGDGTDPPAPAPEAPAAPETDTPAAPETTTPDPFDAGADKFDRPYVEKLRQENQQYRQRWKPYEDTFSSFHETDREAMLHLARTLQQDPSQAASLMRQYADVLTPAEQAAVAEAAGQDQGTGDRPLTAGELDRILSEREQQKAQEDAVRGIESEAKNLGYAPGSREYVVLLWEAKENHDGDLRKAADALKAADQKRIDEYLESKRQEAAVAPSPQAGVAPNGSQVPANQRDAETSMKSRLDALFGPKS